MDEQQKDILNILKVVGTKTAIYSDELVKAEDTESQLQALSKLGMAMADTLICMGQVIENCILSAESFDSYLEERRKAWTENVLKPEADECKKS